MKRSPRIKVPESGVLRACLDLLAAEGIWHERRNTGGMTGEYKGKKRFVKFSANGTADILATPHGYAFIRSEEDYTSPVKEVDDKVCIPKILWIECKSDSGTQSPDQIEFQKTVENHGHWYLLVRSSDDLKAWLKDHGAIR